MATKKVISVAKDFSPFPGGRYPEDGDFSAEEFRKKFLIPTIESHPNEKIILDLDGGEGYGTSFLEEAFGGLIRDGYSKEDIYNTFDIKSEYKSYIRLINEYINNASKKQAFI